MQEIPDVPLTASPPRQNPLCEKYWYEAYLKGFCFGNKEDQKLKKPSPLLWAAYLLQSLNFDLEKGRSFSKLCVEENIKILGENLYDLEEYVMLGHVPKVKKELKAWKRDEDQKEFYKDRKSVLHYAVMSRNPELVEYLLMKEGCLEIINRNDFITGFSPLHLALFFQSPEIIWILIKNGADFHLQDNYGATMMDYAYLLDYAPSRWDTILKTQIPFWSSEKAAIEQWSPSKFEETFNVKWGQYYKCTEDYIFELLFSGFAVGEKDMSFRKKYFPIMEKSSGDENLILAKIDEKVGYGVYAAKDFEKDDFIVRYVGQFVKDEEDRVYCMESGIEGIVLSALSYRNLGGMINHSASRPNAEARCVFDTGVEQAIIISLRPIKKGEQVLIDYSKAYGEGCGLNFVEFGESEGFPNQLPL